MSDTSSDTLSSSSSSSTDSNCFNSSDLLQVLGILLLPTGSEEDLDIIEWKDSEIIDLLENIYNYFEFESSNFKSGFSKIISFINTNRKLIRKRRVNLNRIEDDKLRLLITDGLNDLS